MAFETKRISNYEGFKRLDQLQEKIATGKLKPPRDAKVEHFCNFCKCNKRSQQLVPSRLMGVPISAMPVECKTAFQGRFVLACAECAEDMRRAGVR